MMVGGFSMRISGMRRTNQLVERDLHPKVVSLAKRRILMDVVGGDFDNFSGIILTEPLLHACVED